ncbi:MAG: hypothetical protein ACD_79C01497G0001 [uncultured bacterium]|nr:MAG: hypothetical protein ACD_79C01497G0001 [uncultured bacterium]
MSRCLSGIHPPEGPPIWTALYFLPLGIPPPILNTMSLTVVPIATSTSPVLVIFPDNANTLVPLLFNVPTALNFSNPCSNIQGRLASVSTLLIMVGFPNNPDTAGNGGLGRGMPRLPSILCIRAVSSPQTNAPAPFLIIICRFIPLSKILFPRKPYSFDFSIACSSLTMARGYSALI